MNPALLTDSSTVATLNARAELRRLRALAGASAASDEASAELDRLEDVLASALHLDDEALSDVGYAPMQTWVPKEEVDSLQEERDDLEVERDEARERLEELLQAAAESPDEVLSRLTKALAEVDRLKAKLESAERERDTLRKDPTADRVRAALYNLHPGRRSKPKLEQHEKTLAAIEAALRGQS